MSLAPGTRFGSYEVVEPIGAGGMGEVYRATDTKLDRDVAIKTLPANLTDDANRLARFEREAKLLAALNHAHIASVYSLGEHDGTIYIAMELVEGQTLEEKIRRGPMPIEDALHLGLQIASALEAAHEKGVVHRDLKPANIMITADGVVKVLDFGLAKAFMGDPNEASPGHSPALSLAMTQQGLVLGTAAYMSPEQASGQGTDQRADIWAFGVVLYEMLTGQPLFGGESVPHILADVLKTEPDWTRLPRELHPRVRLMLERCLDKRVRNRYHSIADVRVDIEKALAEPDRTAEMRASGSSVPAPAWIAAGIVVAIGAAAAVWALKPEPPPFASPVLRWSIVLDETRSLASGEAITVAGDQSIAYATPEGIRFRSAGNSFDDRLIYEGDARWPAISPEGDAVVFYDRGDEALKKVQVQNSVVTTLCRCGDPWGVTWSPDREWLYVGTGSRGVFRIPATGGEPQNIIPPPAMYPQALPDGRAILFVAGDILPDRSVNVFSLESGQTTPRFPGYWAKYVNTGHVIGILPDSDTLVARTFNPESFEFGDAVEVLHGVPVEGIQIAIDGSGVVAFVAEGARNSDSRALAIFSRDDNELRPIGAEERNYGSPRISPDGTRIAVHADADAENDSIYLIDVSGSGRDDRRLTFSYEGSNRDAVWSPDSEQLAFYSTRNDEPGIYVQPVNGSEPARRLTTADENTEHLPSSWSANGFLAYSVIDNVARTASVEFLNLDSLETTELTVVGSASRPVFSADGNLIAYLYTPPGVSRSDSRVVVERFPRTDGQRIELSVPSRKAVWSPEEGSTELFYVTQIDGEAVLQSSIIETVPELASRQGETFDVPEIDSGDRSRNFDPLPDGTGWLVRGSGDAGNQVERVIINVISNWGEELKELVPAH